MKIRRIQITIEPHWKGPLNTFSINVWVDGRHFSTANTFHEDDFQDIFGYLMKNAESCIRDMAAGHKDALDILDKLP